MSQRAACPYYSTCEPSGDRRAGKTRSFHSLIAFVPCLMMNLAFPECPRLCGRTGGGAATGIRRICLGGHEPVTRVACRPPSG
jgi:hypothetical protein